MASTAAQSLAATQPLPRKKGHIAVYDTDLLEDFVSSLPAPPPKATPKKKEKREPIITPETIKRQKYEQLREQQAQAHAEAIQRGLEQRRRHEDAQFSKIMTNLKEVHQLEQQVGSYVTMREMTDHRRKEQLFKLWSKTVFDPIQSQLQSELDKRPITSIEARRTAQLQEYLDATNRGQGLFRDIVIERDYDPFKANRAVMRLKTSHLDRIDPVKRDLIKNMKETKQIADLNPDMHIIEPRRRPVLDILLWDKLESTPHGRYAAMVAKAAATAGNKPVVERPAAKDSVVLDHFNIPREQSLVKAEFFPRGKKVNPDSKIRQSSFKIQ